MVKDRKKKRERTKKNDAKSFLKKRAPFYLAGIALLVVFVIPEITKVGLENSLPELSPEDQQVFDTLMGYNGPNETGLTVVDAIKNKINDEYPNENIFDNKKTNVDLDVIKINSEEYQIILNFKSHKGEMNYDWNINTSSGKIISNNQGSKHIIELVDFS